jgi:hypothetical protein
VIDTALPDAAEGSASWLARSEIPVVSRSLLVLRRSW